MKQVALLLLLLVGAMFAPDALASCWVASGSAGEWSKNHNYVCSTQSESFAKAHGFCGQYPYECEVQGPKPASAGYAGSFTAGRLRDWGVTIWWVDSCANGWNADAGMCNPTGEECLARNTEPGFFNVGETTRNFHSRCVAGCEFKAQQGAAVVTVGGGSQFVTGVFDFSGNTCSAETMPPLEEEAAKQIKEQECEPAPDGQTFCVKKNGQQCFSGAENSQICWMPGEVGEKSNGPILQKRNAGPLPLAPTTQPPEGTTFVQKGDSYTTITNEGDTTISTTITNYITSTGVDATPNDSGEPADGSGGGDDGEGLEGVNSKLQTLLDGLTGDGQDHAGDGAQPGDTNVWAEDGVIDGSSLDTSGWGGGSGSCPALWTSGGEGLAGAFAIATPDIWCDYIANIRLILIAFATITGIFLLARGGK